MATEKTAQELEQEKQQLEKNVAEAGKQAEQDARKEGLTEDQVNERVQKARKEEKDKLYPQLEEVKSALREVQEELKAEREQKEAVKREAQKQAEEERKAKLSADEVTREMVARLEEQLKEEREERERFKSELEERSRREEINRYKQNALQAAGNELIPELVKGNSVEEIDRSIQIAKARYAEVVEKAKEEARKQFQRGLSTASPDTEAFEDEELRTQIGNIDPEKYAKDPQYRERILSMAASTYQRTGR